MTSSQEILLITSIFEHLVTSMCRVVSCVVGRRCLLWPVCSFWQNKSFALLHFVVQGQTCLLLQVFPFSHSQSIPKSDWLYSLQLKMEKVYIVSKNKTWSWLWLRSWAFIEKFRLKLKKVGKTTRPLRYDLNQIPYDYTVKMMNRFKGLDLVDRVPEDLWKEVWIL